MINCTKCTGPNVCTECDANTDSKYLKVDKTGCVKACGDKEFISVVNEIRKFCYSACPSNHYHDTNDY